MYFYKFLSGGANKAVDISDNWNDFVEDSEISTQEGNPDFFDLDNPKFVDISDIWKYFVYKCKTSTQEENPDFFDVDNPIMKLKFIMCWVGFLRDIKYADSFSASLKNEIKYELITKRFFTDNNHDLKKTI